MTTRADEPKPMITKVFSVADLVIPIPDQVRCGAPEPPKPLLTDALIKTVTGMVRPSSWETAGGRGRTQFTIQDYNLSVTNTPEVIAEVSDLLEALRRLQDTQIAFGTRVMVVPAEVNLSSVPAKAGEVAFLTDRQLLTVMEAVQTDRRANLMQLPKLTTFPCQTATICCTETEKFFTALEAQRVDGRVALVPRPTLVELGTTVRLRGELSADKRFVCVNVSYTNKHVEKGVEMIPVTTTVTPVFEGGSQGKPTPVTQFLQAPPQVETTKIDKDGLMVPSGTHVVIAGPTVVQETRTEFWAPVLSELPYMNRLFKNVGVSRSNMRLIVIVSPLVIDAGNECR
jgi:type II secretory pathway component GspD/PulD (secretin)